MDVRAIGDQSVSLLGYGCMRFPTKDGKIDEPRAEALLRRAYEAGVTYFDTAYPYHNGESEPFVGRVMKQFPRDTFALATKFPCWKPETLEEAKAIYEEQMTHLQSEYVDFYLIHALSAERWAKVKEMGLLDFLEEQQKLGRIRKLGFSFHAPYEVFEEILAYRKWDFCQIQFNYMDTEHQAGLKGLQLAESLGVSVVVMEPVKGGTLAGLPAQAEAPLKAVSPGRSSASLALRYVAGFSGVKVILSGMSDEAQLEDNIASFSPYVPFSDYEKVALDETIAILKSRMGNGCSGCRYCLPCASGVMIPRLFLIYNEFQRYENPEAAREDYQSVPALGRASCCIRCGKCETMCPQGIHIREDLKTIANMDWAK